MGLSEGNPHTVWFILATSAEHRSVMFFGILIALIFFNLKTELNKIEPFIRTEGQSVLKRGL